MGYAEQMAADDLGYHAVNKLVPRWQKDLNQLARRLARSHGTHRSVMVDALFATPVEREMEWLPAAAYMILQHKGGPLRDPGFFARLRGIADPEPANVELLEEMRSTLLPRWREDMTRALGEKAHEHGVRVGGISLEMKQAGIGGALEWIQAFMYKVLKRQY